MRTTSLVSMIILAFILISGHSNAEESNSPGYVLVGSGWDTQKGSKKKPVFKSSGGQDYAEYIAKDNDSSDLEPGVCPAGTGMTFLIKTYKSKEKYKEGLNIGGGIRAESQVIKAQATVEFEKDVEKTKDVFITTAVFYDFEYIAQIPKSIDRDIWDDDFRDIWESAQKSYNENRTQGQKKFNKLFKTYGDHYVLGVVVGGKGNLLISTNKESSLKKEKIEAHVEAEYSGLLNKGSAEASLSRTEENESYIDNRTVAGAFAGGDTKPIKIKFTKEGELMDGMSEAFNTWKNSISDNPVVVARILEPIWELGGTQGDESENAKAAYRKYLKSKDKSDTSLSLRIAAGGVSWKSPVNHKAKVSVAGITIKEDDLKVQKDCGLLMVLIDRESGDIDDKLFFATGGKGARTEKNRESYRVVDEDEVRALKSAQDNLIESLGNIDPEETLFVLTTIGTAIAPELMEYPLAGKCKGPVSHDYGLTDDPIWTHIYGLSNALVKELEQKAFLDDEDVEKLQGLKPFEPFLLIGGLNVKTPGAVKKKKTEEILDDHIELEDGSKFGYLPKL